MEDSGLREPSPSAENTAESSVGGMQKAVGGTGHASLLTARCKPRKQEREMPPNPSLQHMSQTLLDDKRLDKDSWWKAGLNFEL